MKKNNIISIMAVCVSLVFSSCIHIFAKDIKGDGKLVTKSIHISDFSKVEIETFVEVNYSQEKSTGKLEFTVDQNLWEYYDIHTKNNVLYIKLKEEFRNKVHPNPTKSLLTVSSEHLEEIEIAGSSKFNFCTAFTSPKLEIGIAGSGKIFAHQHPVNIENCNIEIAGSGDVYLKGMVKKAAIEIAGSGDLKALDCKFSQLNVEIAGSGSVEAHVTDTLNVEIAGSGKVNYTGNPTVSTDIAGSGKVKKL
jgi:hypothetical protein